MHACRVRGPDSRRRLMRLHLMTVRRPQAGKLGQWYIEAQGGRVRARSSGGDDRAQWPRYLNVPSS